MIKTMLSKFNLTGRKFVCLNNKPGLLEDDEFYEHFKTGETYVEAETDVDGQNHIKDNENVLLLLTREGLTLYVDANDFLLIKETVDKIVLDTILSQN